MAAKRGRPSMSPEPHCVPHRSAHRPVQDVTLKCSMSWMTTCQIMMKRKRLPDARCHTVQERHTSFVTSATSTCALCHTKTASRLLIENENIWKHHVQVPVPFQVNVLSVHYPNIKSMVMCWKFQSFFFFFQVIIHLLWSCTCFYKIASFLYLLAGSGFHSAAPLLFHIHTVTHLSSSCACSELCTD